MRAEEPPATEPPLAENGNRSQPCQGARNRMATEMMLNLKTTYPDVVIEVGKVIFGEKERDDMKADLRKIQNKRITRAACALLNSGGGLIKAEIGNKQQYIYEEQRLGLDIEQSQRDLIQSADLQKYFETLHQNKYLLIFVKSWNAEFSSAGSPVKPHICSLSTSLYRRSGTSVIEMNPSDALEFLKQKETCAKQKEIEEPLAKKALVRRGQESNIQASAAQFFERDQLKEGETLNFSESIHVEFKHFPTNSSLKRFKETLPKYISSFANTEGGYLIFGVQDKTRKVAGFSNDNASPDTLKEEMERAVQKLKLHCLHFCSSDGDLKCEMKTMPVCSKDSLFICAIRIEPLCCAVFLDYPDSWIIQDSHIKQLDPEEWKDKMMATDPDIQSLTENFNTALSISGSPPTVLPVYTKKGLECLNELKGHLFKGITHGITVKPKTFCDELFNKHPGLRDDLMKEMPRSPGVLMFSKSWAVDVGKPENEHVVCDALFIAFGTCPTLYTIFYDQNPVHDTIKEYSRSVAFIIKQKLVNVGGYTEKVCVIPKLFHISKARSSVNAEDTFGGQHLEVEYPDSYKLTSTERVNDFQKALVIVLLSFRSLLSDRLGCEFFNLLTFKQYELLSKNLQKTRQLFIHGLPGTGKTVVAMKIMEKIKNVFNCSTAEILYICENQPLRKYLSSKQICQAVTRVTFMKKSFSEIKHIVVDEAQNFRLEDGNWYAKAKKLCSNSQNRNGPGVLWIFLDYFQTYHPFQSGLPLLNTQFSQEWLTKGVRNATQIYHVMQETMKKIAAIKEASAESRALGEHLNRLLTDAECTHSIPGVCEEQNLDTREMAKYVARECSRYLQKGYLTKDIAILCNTEKDIADNKHILEVEMRRLRMQTSLVRTDDDVITDGIVLDSVRRFSGLERNIVFGIHPVPVLSDVASNLLLCVASRANTHLHIIFLTDKRV